MTEDLCDGPTTLMTRSERDTAQHELSDSVVQLLEGHGFDVLAFTDSVQSSETFEQDPMCFEGVFI